MPAPPIGPSSPELRIDVDQEAGDVSVDVRGLIDREPFFSRLVHNGVSLPLGVFLALGGATRNSEGWVILSMMEPGQYSFCPKPQDPPSACTSGWLAVGGELKLGAMRPAANSSRPGSGEPR